MFDVSFVLSSFPLYPFSLPVMFILVSHLDFKNPNDPHDKDFDPHPTDYPVGELEFPNSGATEKYVIPPLRSLRPWRLAILPPSILMLLYTLLVVLPVCVTSGHQIRLVWWGFITRALRQYLISALNAVRC